MSSSLLMPPGVPGFLDTPAPETLAQRMKACSVVTYSERALYRLPWCGLHARPSRSAAKGSGNPGAFERTLFRALEWIAIDQSVAQGVPFSNPLIVHPRDICERLCWRATQPQFRAIEQGFEALCRLRLQGAPEDGPGSKSFGVLRSAVAATPRGGGHNQICPDFIIHFDGRFIDSINAGHILPINWGLWVALQDPLTQRLLEILEFEWPHRGDWLSATLDLDLLSERLPLRGPLGRLQRQALLAQAHDTLIREGYLRQVELRSGDRYRYAPGNTFLAMRYRLQENHERVMLAGIRSGALKIGP